MENNCIVSITKYLTSIKDAINLIQVNKKYQQGVLSLTTTPFYKEKDVKKEIELFSNATTITCDYTCIPLNDSKLIIHQTDSLYSRCSLLQAAKRIEKITMDISEFNKNTWKLMPLKLLIINCIEELNGSKTSQNPYPFQQTINLPNCIVRIICDISQLDNVMNNLPKQKLPKNCLLEVHNGPIITLYRNDEWVFGFKNEFITMHMQDLKPFIEKADQYAVENIRIIDFINPEEPAEPSNFSISLSVKKLILQDLNCPIIELPNSLEELTITNCSVTSLQLNQSNLKKVIIEQCADLKTLIITSPIIECEAVYLKSLQTLQLPNSLYSLKLNNSSLPIKSFPPNLQYLSLPSIKQLTQLEFPQHLKELNINSCFIVDLPELNVNSIIFFQCTFAKKIFVKANSITLNGCYFVSNLDIDCDSIFITGCTTSTSSQVDTLIEYNTNNAKVVHISSFNGINKLIAHSCKELKLVNNSQLSEVDAECVTSLQLIHTNITKTTINNLESFDIDNNSYLPQFYKKGSGSLRLEKCKFDCNSQILNSMIDISLNEVDVESINISTCKGARFYNCPTLKTLSIKEAEVVILVNLPLLQSISLPKSLKNIVINNCPNIINIPLPFTSSLTVDYNGSFKASEQIQIRRVNEHEITVDSYCVQLEDISNSKVILGKNVHVIIGVGLNNVSFINLEESNVQSFDLSMSNNMSLTFPQSLTLINIIGCQSVLCTNISSCLLVPERIRKDYSSNKYEEIPKDKCVIC
ncbi:hypothetical protein ENUP19_0317G0029 [Entamoeba nuttalli]